jgi:peptidoglycan hydrolase FlgJ
MTALAPSSPAAAAKQFEAVALTELLQPMFATLDEAGGMFGGGVGETAWRPMLVQAIAQQIAAHGGIGLAAPVLRTMLGMQEADGQEAPMR